MISGISKKVIFFSFLFINFIQPSKSAEFAKVNDDNINKNTKLIWSKINPGKTLSNTPKISHDNNSHLNLLQTNLDLFLVAKAENQQELIIQSDKQSEINDVIYAEGNVLVTYKGKRLKADSLVYDKLNLSLIHI